MMVLILILRGVLMLGLPLRRLLVRLAMMMMMRMMVTVRMMMLMMMMTLQSPHPS